MSGDIRNCINGHRCEKKWVDLTVAWSWPIVRYCGECKRSVHLCTTDSELVVAIKHNRCVAVAICDIENAVTTISEELTEKELLHSFEHSSRRTPAVWRVRQDETR